MSLRTQHIYDRHVELVKELITRKQHPAPKILAESGD